MDFSKLLQHCRDKHGVKLEHSEIYEVLKEAISTHFFYAHDIALHNTELFDILECLQERPKPGNPPPIVAEMKQRAFEYIGRGEPTGLASWRDEYGVLLSNEQALAIVEFCERVNAPEQLPEPVICFRPDWENIDPKFNYVAVDESHEVYAYRYRPQFNDIDRAWQGRGFDYLQDLNFAKMLWQRPGHGQKEGAE